MCFPPIPEKKNKKKWEITIERMPRRRIYQE
jgi:hypothetical protein